MININLEDLTEIEIKQLFNKNSEEISKHDNLYYNEDSPIISDAKYDELRELNNEILKRYPKITNQPDIFQKVGAPVSKKFEKIAHILPMLSLDNATSKEDVEEFINKVCKLLKSPNNHSIEIIAETKVDGLSASLHYKNQKLIYGLTRGDGVYGEDVTKNLATINAIPPRLKIQAPEYIEIRGEVYISNVSFMKLNQSQLSLGKPIFSNPRNAASGSLRQIDPKVTAERNLSFFAYNIGKTSTPIGKNISEVRLNLKKMGFLINEPSKVCKNIDEMLAFYGSVYTNRTNLEYDIDGIVYKVTDLLSQERLGNVQRAPRWAIAHKFPSAMAKTKIKDIFVTVGRTGAITPVANLVEVTIGGVRVKRATLHNEDEIKKLNVRIHDTVTIHRAGDVIPKIKDVDFSQRPKDSVRYIFPSICPSCGSTTVKHDNESIRRCLSDFSCPEQSFQRLVHYVSKNAIDIEGLGRKQLLLFWEKGLIKNFADIYTLARRDGIYFEKLSLWEGWGKVSTRNLYTSIENRRKVDFDRFLYGLGIRHLGKTGAMKLARRYKNFSNLKNTLCLIKDKESQEYMDFISQEGFGGSVYNSLIEFFLGEETKKIINDLLVEIEIISVIENYDLGELSGKTIVFTGVLENITRNEAKFLAEKAGAYVSNNISKNIDYLVYGSKAGSKIEKAKYLKIDLMNEEEFFKLIK